ncbi:hypothetical protein E3P99_03752 [Wallemia hederae]|uniref:Endopeptidase S2P n=1 Tax=Wallemia hederae TaxID=1540922 RepID=A0A4T0FDF3_9BASI|nr:hypothetical protein E3P99_03752 [Wallemia hederae]
MKRFEFKNTGRLKALEEGGRREILRRGYDAGVLISIASAFVTIAVLLKDSTSILSTLYNLFINASSASPSLRARSVYPPEPVLDEALSGDLIIKPVLPGWTSPLADLPIFLLAFLVIQGFHEAGHALAALCEGVEIVSVGVALAHAVIPGAFVALSQSQLASLPFMPRARVICAGAYHNFILALTVSVAVYICSDQLFVYVGDHGRLVTEVSKKSELYGYIHPNTLITSIDTVSLGGDGGISRATGASRDGSAVDSYELDIWDRYLSSQMGSGEGESHYAWKVDRDVFNSSDTSCCRENSVDETVSSVACFIPHRTPLAAQKACLDPSQVMLANAVDCNAIDEETSVCVRPHPLSHIMRIGYLGREGENESILVQSSKRFLWDTLRVSTYAPKFPSIMTDFLIHFLSTLAQYTITLSVTFGMLNMLPLPMLDGSELVEAVLGVFGGSINRISRLRGPVWLSGTTPDPTQIDLIELEGGRTRSHSHQQVSMEKHVMRVLHALTLTLVVFALGGSLLLQFIDSSV